MEVSTRKATLGNLAAAVDSFTGAARLALPPDMDKTHSSDIASTIAARETLTFGTFTMMMSRGEIDGALQIVAAAVIEAQATDPRLFDDAPTIDQLTDLWVDTLRLRVGATLDRQSTRNSVDYMVINDRRRLAYKFTHERAALLASREAA